MRVLTAMTSLFLALTVFGGCSPQQINETTDSIVNDVKNVGEKATEQRE
jgi:hypothetical protein